MANVQLLQGIVHQDNTKRTNVDMTAFYQNSIVHWSTSRLLWHLVIQPADKLIWIYDQLFPHWLCYTETVRLTYALIELLTPLIDSNFICYHNNLLSLVFNYIGINILAFSFGWMCRMVVRFR